MGEVQLEEFPEWWMGIKIKSSKKKKKKKKGVGWGEVWRRTGGREKKRKERKEKRKISRGQKNQAAPCLSMSKQAA